MTRSVPQSTADREVMAALDDADQTTQLLIADVTRDDAWLSITASDAPVISNMYHDISARAQTNAPPAWRRVVGHAAGD
ncbi:DUF7556 family protein [Halomarina litorea]|uniref:DUF7556 family protein n=1 Tax=Halomarina litorea TaxID=2961595 RepID=UPI0020C2F7F6|nr:hypothetical protein [Halomarina sp. BCD28]